MYVCVRVRPIYVRPLPRASIHPASVLSSGSVTSGCQKLPKHAGSVLRRMLDVTTVHCNSADLCEERSIIFYDSGNAFACWSEFIVVYFRSYCRVCRCGVLGFPPNSRLLIDGKRRASLDSIVLGAQSWDWLVLCYKLAGWYSISNCCLCISDEDACVISGKSRSVDQFPSASFRSCYRSP